MLLRRILEDLVEAAPGATGALLADWEGEAVVWCNRNGSDYHLKVIGAHHGVMLELVRALAQRLDQGSATEMSFVQNGFNVVTAPVSNEYYLVLTTKSSPVLARPALKDAIRRLKTEIP